MLGDAYPHIVEFDDARHEEALMWIRERKIKGLPFHSYVKGKVRFRFAESSDAMMFKLVFGGQ